MRREEEDFHFIKKNHFFRLASEAWRPEQHFTKMGYLKQAHKHRRRFRYLSDQNQKYVFWLRNNKLDPDEAIDLRGLDRYTAIWKLDLALADVYAKWDKQPKVKVWMYTI